jgi:polyribonucleotide nucleotidyltransferase
LGLSPGFKALVDAQEAVGESETVQFTCSPDIVQVNAAFKAVLSGVMRRLVLKEGLRPDGRSVTQVRPIRSRANLLPRTHGSVLFTRGETQVCARILAAGDTLVVVGSDKGETQTWF